MGQASLDEIRSCVDGGISMNAAVKILNVSAQSVLNGVRKFGEANYEKPTPEFEVVVELDELWHFIQEKKR